MLLGLSVSHRFFFEYNKTEKKMRLDKYFSTIGRLSRKECLVEAKKGRICVNGEVVKNPSVHVDPERDEITLSGERVSFRKYFYLMLNKPEGTISSTENSERTVMKLLSPEYERAGGFPCGRLDVDTVGLLLITNDGDTAHMLLSPKRHVVKTYRFCCSEPLDSEMIASLEGGVDLGDFVTAPAKVNMTDATSGEISISEGKFHQIKRMLASVGSGITYLERVRFGPLELDASLERGEWRELTKAETDSLLAVAGTDKR